ncbi:isocitrate lyase/PEP mutase family protein [Streptomyces profundus]|uniref:isocitrate lyase/PEP mutase family protein n=1 Tax=Streptomyces profundus TaxID=2867410 RepID=UPI001D166613|nr:isocitrate lyase/phosphoenolpyruvate mutase family protein [Streptomyces sp. MA3_2.13]UED87046.1 isocitrate lyase/phosphoenolpyruvate mutase family protein [Streptomyces sp. MA3_2.13]
MSETANRVTKARLLHSLHHGAEPLVLPNAWDALSARLVARAGAAAVATTSSGVAWSLGAPDGDVLARTLAVDLIARVVSAVDVPVTADIESGYAPDPAGVAETIRQVLAAGAVGVNLEDSAHDGTTALRPVAEQRERLAAARGAAEEVGVPLYLNARVDVFLRGAGAGGSLLDATLERARAYLDEGASGVFVPGVTDPEIVRTLVDGLDAPVNVLAGPGAPAIAELAAAGAARVSVGSGLAQSAYAVAERAAAELLTKGTYQSLERGYEYGELDALMRAEAPPRARPAN